jgi:hypothetical protein
MMHEIMKQEKYQPVKQRAEVRDGKEPARIQEILEEVEELEVTEKETTQGMDQRFRRHLLTRFSITD